MTNSMKMGLPSAASIPLLLRKGRMTGMNINVNAVCPGTVESPMLDGLASQVALDEDVYEHFSQRHLFQDRHITPGDIARAVRWLASDESRCITGTTINVDAGWSAAG